MRTPIWLTGLVLLLAGCSASVQPLEAPAHQETGPALGPLTASDYSPHLDVLALGFGNGNFEVRSPAPRHLLGRGHHDGQIVNLALSQDAKRLATVDSKGTLAISSVETGELEVIDGALPLSEAGLVGLAWDSAGRRLAVSAGPLVRIVDLERPSGCTIRLKEPISAVTFSPDESQLVAAGQALHFLDAHDLSERDTVSLNATGEATDVRFSPDGKLLGVLMLGRVAFFEVAGRSLQQVQLDMLNPVGLRFASDGRVAIFGRSALYIGPVVTSDIPRRVQPAAAELWDVEFREDDSLLFIGSNPNVELSLSFEEGERRETDGSPALGGEARLSGHHLLKYP